MDSENNYEQKLIAFCEEDDEFKIYCPVCDNFCILRFYKNHLKSKTHINNSNKSS